MKLSNFNPFRSASNTSEVRNIENPKIPISSEAVLRLFGVNETSKSGELVTIDSALGEPPIGAAVNFLAAALASLPLAHYRKNKKGREKQKYGLGPLLARAVNEDTTSFDWRKSLWMDVFTHGRSFSFIEKTVTGKIINLYRLDPSLVHVKRTGGKTVYIYQENQRDPIQYDAADIIDVYYSLKSDGLTHRSPIFQNRNTIGLMQAITNYSSKFFENGGVPPFAIEGPFTSSAGMQRSSEDLASAVKAAASNNRLALTLPNGHKMHKLGIDPKDSQMIDVQKFGVFHAARIYQLPPIFLQDLTTGNFNNVEQQDLNLVKHTLRQWIVAFEQQLNLKLFGRAKMNDYVEHSIDALLRGDFKSRMEGYAKGIQNAVLTPNEVRKMENREEKNKGNDLLIQGATVPLGRQPVFEKPKDKGDDNGET